MRKAEAQIISTPSLRKVCERIVSDNSPLELAALYDGLRAAASALEWTQLEPRARNEDVNEFLNTLAEALQDEAHMVAEYMAKIDDRKTVVFHEEVARVRIEDCFAYGHSIGSVKKIIKEVIKTERKIDQRRKAAA